MWGEVSSAVARASRSKRATTVRRAEQRDCDLFGSPEAIRQRYAGRYVPGQRIYLAEVEPERRASVVVDNEDPCAPRILSG